MSEWRAPVNGTAKHEKECWRFGCRSDRIFAAILHWCLSECQATVDGTAKHDKECWDFIADLTEFLSRPPTSAFHSGKQQSMVEQSMTKEWRSITDGRQQSTTKKCDQEGRIGDVWARFHFVQR